MSSFMDNYEDVNSRIKRFRDKYENCRILTDVVNFQPENGWVLVKCSIWKNISWLSENEPADAIDYAFGDRETYPANMKKWFVEDTVTSAIGRCIALLIEVDHKATKQNMSRVERVTTTKVENPSDPWTTIEKPMPKSMDTAAIAESMNGEIIETGQSCKHGLMTLKEGTSKTGKSYHGYVCKFSGVGPGEECKPVWYDLSPSGKWIPPKAKG